MIWRLSSSGTRGIWRRIFSKVFTTCRRNKPPPSSGSHGKNMRSHRSELHIRRGDSGPCAVTANKIETQPWWSCYRMDVVLKVVHLCSSHGLNFLSFSSYTQRVLIISLVVRRAIILPHQGCHFTPLFQRFWGHSAASACKTREPNGSDKRYWSHKIMPL
jgi:hypothetical protein